ncbi:MAG: 2Fe-2S iron-sulfur cluster binding domain-containing protein, partial [Candidatus Bathyarchaeota archaeon]
MEDCYGMEAQVLEGHIKILFDPMNKEISVKPGTILLDAMRDAGIRVESICGGKGECGKCRVVLVKGERPSLSSKSKRFLTPEEISEGYYLACQIRVSSDSTFTIPVESLVANPKILTITKMSIERLDPPSKKYLATLFPSSDAPRPSIRLRNYSGPEPRVSEAVYKHLDGTKHEQLITVTLSRTHTPPEVINVEPGDRTSSNYGLAVDIGTTTIAALLADLTNGQTLGTASTLNKQVTYGETLLTRIAFSRKAFDGLGKLQQAVVQSINDLLKQLVSSAGIQSEEITSISAGGNTVMNHLLMGTDVDYLWFVDANDRVLRHPIIKRAKEIGLHANPEAYV